MSERTEQLRRNLETALDELYRKPGATIKDVEVAFQEEIENVYTDTPWWKVTNYRDIFNALFFDNMSPEEVIEIIIDKAEAYEEAGSDKELEESKSVLREGVGGFKIKRYPTANGKKIQIDSGYSVFTVNGGSEAGNKSMWNALVSAAKNIIERENIEYYTISRYIQPNYGILILNLRTFPSQEAKEAWESRKHGFEEIIELEESKSLNEKIKMVMDLCTPTAERRPTTIEDIYDDFKVLEFNSKKELANELARMSGYKNLKEFKQELVDEGINLDDYDFEGDALDKICQYFLSAMSDPSDGSPNIQYISINGKPVYEDYWMTYDTLSDNMDLLAHGSEEDIIKYYLKYEYDYIEDEDDSEDDKELGESFKSMDKKGLNEKIPADLAKAYRQSAEYRRGEGPLYIPDLGDREGDLDFENTDYIEITPEEAEEYRKKGEADKLEEGKRLESKKPLKEGSIGNELAKYQKWVDYDMKRYGKISDKTKEELKDAGLELVKDQYGDYEVIAKDK